MFFCAVLFILFDIVTTTNENNTDILAVKSCPSSLACSLYNLPSSLSKFVKEVTFPNDKSLTCIGKEYISDGTEIYCAEISNECHHGFEPSNELLEQLEKMSQFVGAFSNCFQIFKEKSSAVSGYYVMHAPNGSLISVYCDIVEHINSLHLDNCSHIIDKFNAAPSTYYTIQAPNGSFISVYCNMGVSICDGRGGWMRIVYVNMSESGATCPTGLSTFTNFPNITYPLCDQVHSRIGGCSSTIFSTFGYHYSQVCGHIRGYQLGGVDSIYPHNGGSSSLEGNYVDGVSITHGSNPRKHIWTFIGGQEETGNKWEDCPCNNGSSESIPQYVGSDFYCESGTAVVKYSTFYSSDPLWDGKQCDYLESPCCTSPNMPWFVKSLNHSTTDDIELRICSSEGYPDEATPVDLIIMYIK